jgi:predicted TIM-barrel fold metal-dependent hydrolase
MTARQKHDTGGSAELTPIRPGLAFPEVTSAGDPRLRAAGASAAPEVPPDTVVVSADGHWLEGDLWIDRFPAELRDKAPRMVFEDGGWQIIVNGKRPPFPEEARMLCQAFECREGMSSVKERLADLDAEGIAKELLFPQRLFGLYVAGDVDMREWVFGCYNHYIAEICAQSRERLYFCAIPNYWDPAAAADSLREVKELGARAVMVPIQPRKDVDGEPIVWTSPKLAPFWTAVEESGLPLCFHIGENLPVHLPGSMPAFVLNQMAGFRPTWGALTYGGLFDRHPALRIVFLEGGISWVASAIHDADMLYHSFRSQVDVTLRHDPSWYWYNHCYATFITDPAGLDLLHRIGADRVLWSADYPHFESSLGYSRASVASVFKAAAEADARRIVGGNAIDLFRLRGSRCG